MRLLFPFNYPIKSVIEILGRITASMCTWSGFNSPSTILTFSSYTASAVFPLFLFAFLHRIPFVNPSVQTLYDIWYSNPCVVIYFRRSTLNPLPLLSLGSCQTALLFFSKRLSSVLQHLHQVSFQPLAQRMVFFIDNSPFAPSRAGAKLIEQLAVLRSVQHEGS